MTKEERMKLFRAYLANHLAESDFSGKDITDVGNRVNMMSDDEVKRALFPMTENIGNIRWALFLVSKDIAGFRIVWFTPERGAYRTICPECRAKVSLKKSSPNSSLGKCKNCSTPWAVSWFGGMMIIKKNK